MYATSALVAAPEARALSQTDALVGTVQPRFSMVVVDNLHFQPCKVSTAFKKSVEQQGVLVPIIVACDRERSEYTVVAGRRRVTAAKGAGLRFLPAMVYDTPAGLNTDAITIIENLHRSRNVASELRAMKTMVSRGMDDDELQAVLGLPKRDFVNLTKLLGLQPFWVEQLESAMLAPSTAAVVAGLARSDQDELAARAAPGKRITLEMARAFRLSKQYQADQLSFLNEPIPALEGPKCQ